MNRLLILLLFICSTLETSAQTLEDLRWTARPVILFTPSADDPLFLRQYELLRDQTEALQERNIHLLLVTPERRQHDAGLFVDQSTAEYYYDYFGARPYHLELLLVGLDGTEKYRAKNRVTPVSVLLELIDSMPMRQREMRQGYGNKSQIDTEQDGRNIPGGGGED